MSLVEKNYQKKELTMTSNQSMSINILKKLLKQNAVTLLMGYARPLIAHLTVDAGYKPLNLPFVDLREDIRNMEE